jgi:glycosyltransferase involved in cell wall biosynthesis
MKILQFLFATSFSNGASRTAFLYNDALISSGNDAGMLVVSRHAVQISWRETPTRRDGYKGNLSRLQWYFRAVTSLFPLGRELLKSKPEVVISHGLLATCATLLVRGSLGAQVPVVFVQHNLISEHLSDTPLRVFGRVLLKYAVNKVDGVLAVSHGVASELRSMGANRIFIQNNPVDVSSIRYKASLIEGVAIPEKFLLFVGRLERQKRLDRLIEAFASSAAPKLGYVLILIGAGSLLAEMRAKARSLGVAELVQFLGECENPFPYMAAATALVLTSDYESFGNVIVEAMALGTPTISTNCPYGPADIIYDKQSGLLVSLGDTGELVRAIDDVCSKPELRDRLSKGCSNAILRFDSSSAADRLGKFLNSVLHGAGPNK